MNDFLVGERVFFLRRPYTIVKIINRDGMMEALIKPDFKMPYAVIGSWLYNWRPLKDLSRTEWTLARGKVLQFKRQGINNEQHE